MVSWKELWFQSAFPKMITFFFSVRVTLTTRASHWRHHLAPTPSSCSAGRQTVTFTSGTLRPATKCVCSTGTTRDPSSAYSSIPSTWCCRRPAPTWPSGCLHWTSRLRMTRRLVCDMLVLKPAQWSSSRLCVRLRGSSGTLIWLVSQSWIYDWWNTLGGYSTVRSLVVVSDASLRVWMHSVCRKEPRVPLTIEFKIINGTFGFLLEYHGAGLSVYHVLHLN